MKLRTVLFGIAGFTGAGLLLLIAAWAVWLNVEKGKVRAIQDEMRAEGLPMTAAELEPAPLAEADNAAPLLERAAALMKDLKKREGWIDAVPAPGKEGERNPANFDEAKLAKLREQMAWPETQEVLRLLREAAAKPGARFERDVTKGPAMELGPVTELLTAARFLGTSAWLAARDGNASAAVADLLASARLGDLVGNPPVLIDWLLSVSLDALSVSMTAGALGELPSGAFHPSVWSGLPLIWKGHESGLRDGLARGLDGDRLYFGGWLFDRMLSDRGAYFELGRSLVVPGYEFEWSTALAVAVYTHRWNPLMHADHAAYLQFMRDVRRSAEGGGADSDLRARIPKTAFFTRLAAPALDQIPQRALEISAQLQLGQVGLALEKWRAEHAHYPDTLAALGLPAAETTDPFSGQPFLYRVKDDGVLLYSVGSDRKDDGGTTTKRRDLVWQVRRGSVTSAAP